jgi:hypothetical protein
VVTGGQRVDTGQAIVDSWGVVLTNDGGGRAGGGKLHPVSMTPCPCLLVLITNSTLAGSLLVAVSYAGLFDQSFIEFTGHLAVNPLRNTEY